MNDTNSLRDHRISYAKGELDPTTVAASPFEQFALWLADAQAEKTILEANAMTVATVGTDDQPAARIVLLRGYDERGFVFFTNYASRKGRDLAHVPKAALLWYWDVLERELRIEGTVEKLSSEESDAYFSKRPRGHRLSAWASPQSDVVADRAELAAAMQDAGVQFPADVPRPPHWGGYRVIPSNFEFWQGRPSRVHDRVQYARVSGGWQTMRLAP